MEIKAVDLITDNSCCWCGPNSGVQAPVQYGHQTERGWPGFLEAAHLLWLLSTGPDWFKHMVCEL